MGRIDLDIVRTRANEALETDDVAARISRIAGPLLFAVALLTVGRFLLF